MQYEVTLKLHEDDATGNWGLAPVDTINTANAFNAFWNPEGIFHDVFEHYCEAILPYYSGKGFMTLWGEMCASGHALAYYDLGINSFRYRKGRTDRDFCADTFTIVQEYIYEVAQGEQPYIQFDFTKSTCLCPNQKSLHEWILNTTIDEYEYRLQSYSEERDVNPKSVIWQPGIRRNYTYGFKQGQKVVGKDRADSYDKLDKFLIEWNDITKTNPKELFIDDENAAPIWGFKFKVSNKGKLKIITSIVDEFKNEYPLNQLIA